MHLLMYPISYEEPEGISLFERFFQLGESYRIHRAMCEARQMRIDDLLLLFRLQVLGRPMAKYDTVQNLRLRTSRETGYALKDRRFFRRTRKWMRARLEELHAVRPVQQSLIGTLEYLTTPNGAGASPAVVYARLEAGKWKAEIFRTIAERKKQAAEDEENITPELPAPVEPQMPLEASISRDPDNFIKALVPVGDQGVQTDPSIAEQWNRKWTPNADR